MPGNENGYKRRLAIISMLNGYMGYEYLYLNEQLRDLIFGSISMLKMADKINPQPRDYSFLVLPTAKAYEGFLKMLLVDLGFTTEDEFLNGKKKIGTVLIERQVELRELISKKKLKRVPEKLLTEWDLCRNNVMHFEPDDTIATVKEAEGKILGLCSAINNAVDAFAECFSEERRNKMNFEMQQFDNDLLKQAEEIEINNKKIAELEKARELKDLT